MADEIHGLTELNQSIADINGALSDALPEIVMAAAGIVESEIHRRAPVATGALVRSLDAKSERRKAASATVQIERSGPDGTEHYAIFQEYGTSEIPARPFFRPGVAAAEKRVEAALVSGITSVIERSGQ